VVAMAKYESVSQRAWWWVGFKYILLVNAGNGCVWPVVILCCDGMGCCEYSGT